jgi:Protein O-mannosyl-transferase TMEM260-like
LNEHLPASTVIITILLALGAFGLHGYTAAPDISLVDSAELALAATAGDVAHPPGFPLFLLIGRLFTMLPFDSPARAMKVMSAYHPIKIMALDLYFIQFIGLHISQSLSHGRHSLSIPFPHAVYYCLRYI